MTGAERVRAALADGVMRDRPPFTLWHPLRDAPASGDGFVRAVLEVAEAYGLDLLKVPAPHGEVAPSVRLQDLTRIVRFAGEGLPVLATVGPGDGLAFVRAAVEEAGCAGVFLALPDADAARMTEEEYAARCLTRDVALLGAAVAGWCNVIHLHGAAPHLRVAGPLLMAAQAVSWAEGPALTEQRPLLPVGKCLLGGIEERRIAGRAPAEVAAEAAALRGERNLIVAPFCAVPPETPPANLRAVRDGLDSL